MWGDKGKLESKNVLLFNFCFPDFWLSSPNVLLTNNIVFGMTLVLEI